MPALVPCTSSGRPSTTPRTVTSGRPTSNSQTRVGSTSTGALPDPAGVRHRQIRRAPVPRPGCSEADPAHFRSAGLRGGVRIASPALGAAAPSARGTVLARLQPSRIGDLRRAPFLVVCLEWSRRYLPRRGGSPAEPGQTCQASPSTCPRRRPRPWRRSARVAHPRRSGGGSGLAFRRAGRSVWARLGILSRGDARCGLWAWVISRAP